MRLNTDYKHRYKRVTCEGNSSQNYRGVTFIFTVLDQDKMISLDVSNCFCHMLDGFVSAYDVPTSNNMFQIVENTTSCFKLS